MGPHILKCVTNVDRANHIGVRRCFARSIISCVSYCKPVASQTADNFLACMCWVRAVAPLLHIQPNRSQYGSIQYSLHVTLFHLSFSLACLILHPVLFFLDSPRAFSHAISSWECVFLAWHSFQPASFAEAFCLVDPHCVFVQRVTTDGTRGLLLWNVRHWEVRQGIVARIPREQTRWDDREGTSDGSGGSRIGTNGVLNTERLEITLSFNKFVS